MSDPAALSARERISEIAKILAIGAARFAPASARLAQVKHTDEADVPVTLSGSQILGNAVDEIGEPEPSCDRAVKTARKRSA